MKKILSLFGCTILSMNTQVNADLAQVTDQQLSDYTAAGLGFAIENFVLNSDSAVLKVTGINNAAGTEVPINWSELYIMGEGSQKGTVTTPTSIGSYLNPWAVRSVLGSADWDGNPATHHSGDYAAIGNDIALLEFATAQYDSSIQNTKQYVQSCIMAYDPSCVTKTSLRRAGMDIGSKFELLLPGGSDYLDIDMMGVFVDGSSLRLWSRAENGAPSELLGQLNINFFAKQIDIGVCQSVCNESLSTLKISNLFLDLNIGYGEIQPLVLNATSDGNFELELRKPNPGPQGVNQNNSNSMIAFYNDYYSNVPKSNVYIGNVQVGNNTVGEQSIRDLSIQYMKFTSQDL
ncbi:MAG: hypothetical protein P1U57_02900 [Oleibacter sp.]|nr:hypothetical protein [Thalassolituus sp.]